MPTAAAAAAFQVRRGDGRPISAPAGGGRGWPGCIKTEELFSALPLPAARRPEPQGGRPGACGGYKPAFEKAGAGTPLYKSKGHSWMLGTMPWCFCLLLVATSTKAT